MISMFRRNLIAANSKKPIILKYTTTSDSQSISLFNSQSTMDKLVQKCKILETGEEISTYQYTFPSQGEHEVEVEWKSGVTSFGSCFQGCSGLTEIPENLFSNNAKVTNFSRCFYGCSGLTEVLGNLFSNCPGVTSFGSCFQGCSGLTEIPENLFSNNAKVTNFSRCFYGCSGLTGTTPKDSDGGELWERAGKEGYPSSITSTSCFGGCTGLENYSSIPSGWK